MADDPARGDAKDVLLQFYQEESNQARHHEEQRSTAANITFAIAGALLAIITAVSSINGKVSWTMFPLIVGLGVLSGVGSALSKKHFERSMHNYARARSYRDCLLMLFTSTEVKDLFDKRVEKIKGIADLKEAQDKQAKAPASEKGKYALMRNDEVRGLETENLQDKKYQIDELNPMNPEVYVTPLENTKHKWLRWNLASPGFDLYKLWNLIYVFMLLMAVVLSGFAGYDAYNYFISDKQPNAKEPIDIRIVTPTPTPK